MLAEPIERPRSATKRPTLPYPGLRPFEETESRNFYGRETEIGAILGLLEEQQLVFVHGASGCGKSSIVRAGVLPTVRLDALASDTMARVVIIKPSDSGGPLRSLAAALEREFPREPAAASRPWSETLVASPDWKADIEEAATKAQSTLCILIDQFEEIFALQRKGMVAEVDRVIEFLISLQDASEKGTALGERPLSVIVTMRSDYLGHCSLWDGFAETVNRSQYLLPKISTLGLLRAIHQPALKYEGSVDEAVADQLLPVMAGEIDGLPILQHALMRAWQDAKPDKEGKRTITVENMNRIGTAAGALSKHAEEAFAKATKGDSARIEAAEWMFRALSDVDADGRIIRRTVMLPDLVAQTGADRATIRAIVDVFRQPEFSFLTPYPPEKLGGESNISVTHEALLRRWHRISSTAFDEKGRPVGLVYREFSDGMIWRSLAVQAEAFASDPVRVLSAAVTEQRLPWYREIEKRQGWALRYPTRNLVGTGDSSEEQWRKVADFMKASEENLAVEHAKLDKEREVVARLRKNRRIIVMLAALVTLLMAALTVVWIWNAEAQVAIAKADEEKARSDEEDARSTAQKGAQRAVMNFQAVTADEMARRACAGRPLGPEALQTCIQEKAPLFYREILSYGSEQQPATSPEQLVRRECARQGASGANFTRCVSEQMSQMLPYGGSAAAPPQ